MANRLGIEMLTLLGMPVVEHVRLAAELGCSSISTGLSRLPMAMFGHAEIWPAWSLSDDPALVRETRAALADTGVVIGLGEGFRVAPGLDVASFAPALDIFASLGTERINAICTEPDEGRMIDQFGQLADMVAARGMRFLVEFAPPHVLNSAPAALKVADALGHDRCGMMLDAMHFFRSGGRVEDIARLPVVYAQMCDVPLRAPAGMDYLTEAMFHRCLPGEGDLPLAEWVAALPPDCAIGLEVPRIDRAASPQALRDHAAACVSAARGLGA